MSKHTAGPWKVHGGIGICVTRNEPIPESGAKPIAVCNQPHISFEEAKANAQLIAAAPELLAACKAALERWGMHSCGEVKLLVNAIAKAEGK